MYKVLEIAHDGTEVRGLGLESRLIKNSEIPSDDEQGHNPKPNAESRMEVDQEQT